MNRRTQFAVLHQSRLEALESCSGPCKYPPALASGAVCHVPALYLQVDRRLTLLSAISTTSSIPYTDLSTFYTLHILRTQQVCGCQDDFASLRHFSPHLTLYYIALISLLPSFNSARHKIDISVIHLHSNSSHETPLTWLLATSTPTRPPNSQELQTIDSQWPLSSLCLLPPGRSSTPATFYPMVDGLTHTTARSLSSCPRALSCRQTAPTVSTSLAKGPPCASALHARGAACQQRVPVTALDQVKIG
jgi:hypothetical protein